jgi:poly-D-alanine transfer protein DltD
MKTMTCKQLGGACDKEFHANSFDEIAEMSKQHGMEMFQKNDAVHLKAMGEIQQLMQKPEAIAEWLETKKQAFEALPDNP